MIELPEAMHLAKEMQEILIGKKIVGVVANKSPHAFAFYFGDPSLYEGQLLHKEIEKVECFGGYIEISLKTTKILLGEGLRITYFEKQDELPKKHQLLLTFDDDTYLVCTIQLYGGMWVFEEGTNDNPYYLVAKTKPSPLSSHFTMAYFIEMVEAVSSKISIKAFLATEQRIPGLGNGILQDILFNAQIHPKTKISMLTKEELEKLFLTTKDTIQKMVVEGGRNTEKGLYGNVGGYQTILSNKTYKDPCPICRQTIVKKNYLGGTIYYCSHCQIEKRLS